MCGVAERILPTALPLASARSDPAREPIKAEREDSPEPKRMLRMVLVTVTVSGWTGLVSPRQFSRSHGTISPNWSGRRQPWTVSKKPRFRRGAMAGVGATVERRREHHAPALLQAGECLAPRRGVRSEARARDGDQPPPLGQASQRRRDMLQRGACNPALDVRGG